MNAPSSSVAAQVEQLHQTYGRLTGQNLTLRFDRERLWFEFHRAGFTPSFARIDAAGLF
jgi:hypothetical protein